MSLQKKLSFHAITLSLQTVMFISSIDFQGLLPVMVKTWFVFLVNAKLLQCSEIGQSYMLRDKASNSRYLETPWTNYFFIQVEYH